MDRAPAFSVATSIAAGVPLARVQRASGRDRPLRALAIDVASYGALFDIVFALSLAPLSRDAIGLLFVLAVLARIAPSAWQIAREQRGALAALSLYVPLAAWVTAAAAPYGDQVHYLPRGGRPLARDGTGLAR